MAGSSPTINNNYQVLPRPPAATDPSAGMREFTHGEVLKKLIKKSLEKQENVGKNTFYGLVVKVLSDSSLENRRVMSDLFLNEEYKIDRNDNTTNTAKSSERIVLLHIPSLYSYFNSYVSEDSTTNDLTSADLFLIPAKTALSLQKSEIVKVSFGDLQNLTDVTILQTGKVAPVIKTTSGKKADLAKQFRNATDACTRLQATQASGSAISSTSVANPNNPTVGYEQFYNNLITSTLTSDNLRNRVLVSLGATQVRQQITKLPAPSTGELSLNQLNSALLNESGYLPFMIDISVGSPLIKSYIESLSALSNNSNQASFPVTVATNALKGLFNFASQTDSPQAEIKKKDRSVYLSFKLIEPANQSPGSIIKNRSSINDSINNIITQYLKNTIESTFKYKFDFVTEGDDVIAAIDIFGKTEDSKLKNQDVNVALEYSNAKRNRAGLSTNTLLMTNTAASIQRAQLTGIQTDPSLLPRPVTIGNTELDACERLQRTINQSAYTPIVRGTLTSNFRRSLTQDNKEIRKIFENPIVANDASGKEFLREAIFRDYPQSTNDLPSETAKFSYNQSFEVISLVAEATNESPNKSKSNATTQIIPQGKRGTNLQKILINAENLLKFSIAFRKFIALNEGIPTENVLLLPLNTFKKFNNPRPGRGVDVNSRHFFGRAIDFVVYLTDDLNFSGFNTVKKIPIRTTAEQRQGNQLFYAIPNDILYVYLIKFINQNKNPFGKSGAALLRDSRSRKTGYVHYEYMVDYREPKKELGFKEPKTKKTRRWVSKPKRKGEKTIYRAAYDKENKDKIILDFVKKDLKSKFQQVPQKLLRLVE